MCKRHPTGIAPHAKIIAIGNEIYNVVINFPIYNHRVVRTGMFEQMSAVFSKAGSPSEFNIIFLSVNIAKHLIECLPVMVELIKHSCWCCEAKHEQASN